MSLTVPNIVCLRHHPNQVGILTMGDDGKMQVGVKGFGEQKANFNPIVGETSNVSQRVQESAAAPLHAGYLLSRSLNP